MRVHPNPLALFPARTGEGDLYRVVQGDSLDLLSRLPPECIDLVFADPPYHLSNGGFTCQSGRRAPVDKGKWDASRGLAEDHAFQRRWLEEVQRILKPTGTVWVSGTHHVIFSIGFAMQELGFHILNTITWYKPNAAPNLACRYFTHSTEFLIWASPRKRQPLAHTFHYAEMKRENGGKQMRDVWSFEGNEEFAFPLPGGPTMMWTIPTPARNEKALGRHPTQKPLALLDRIIRCSSDPGAIVLDPFCGSGTTGVAAVALGRRFIGIDAEAEYVDLSLRRIRAELEAQRSRGAA
ncbi:MAG: DNA methyltransferase [Pseudomonadota bacterium]|nr:MAG: site-specific DNA-methyltransferase [Pseudomonadota bacterium]